MEEASTMHVHADGCVPVSMEMRAVLIDPRCKDCGGPTECYGCWYETPKRAPGRAVMHVDFHYRDRRYEVLHFCMSHWRDFDNSPAFHKAEIAQAVEAAVADRIVKEERKKQDGRDRL